MEARGVESAVAHKDAGAKQTAVSWMDARGDQEGRGELSAPVPSNAQSPATPPARRRPRIPTVRAKEQNPRATVRAYHGASQGTSVPRAPTGPVRQPPRTTTREPPHRTGRHEPHHRALPEDRRSPRDASRSAPAPKKVGGGSGPRLTPPAHQWPPTNTRSRGWEQGMT